jgi:Ca-activated chloride channel family protein
MKRLRRAFVRAVFFVCPILFPVAFNIAVVAQQTPNPTEQLSIPRPNADSIVLPVIVMDKKGNYADGLDKNAFAIYDDKVPQEITFFDNRDEPASIGIIFDLSGSMKGHKQLLAAWNALLRFIELSHSDNEYFVVAVSNRPALLIDWTHDSKTAAEQLSKYNLTSKRQGNTALYDACYFGVEKMRGGAHSKQAILLISDGQDNNSQYTFKNVRERLKETGVMLYSIGLFSGDDPGSALGQEGKAVMNELSSISGGVAVFPDSEKKIGEVFDRLAGELRHQYLLGFKPSKDKANGKWHQIKIKVTSPSTGSAHTPTVYVRNREGYYALKNLR